MNDNDICHRILYKGENIDISQIKVFKCYKKKEEESFLSTIGLKTAKEIQKNYYIYLYETFMYMIKDKIYDYNKKNIKRVGNKFDLFDIKNFSYDDETYKETMLISIEFGNDVDKIINKELYFEIEEGKKFFNEFTRKLLEMNVIKIKEDKKEEKTTEEQNEKVNIIKINTTEDKKDEIKEVKNEEKKR